MSLNANYLGKVNTFSIIMKCEINPLSNPEKGEGEFCSKTDYAQTF